MGADASIYNLIRPQAITPLENPQDIQAKKMRLAQLMGAQELQGLQLEEARSGAERGRRIQDLFSANPNATPDQVAPIDYRAAQALRKEQLEAEAKRATIGKDKAAAGKSEFDVAIGKLERGASILSSAKDQPSYDMALRVMADTFGPAAIEKMPPQFDPGYVKASIERGMSRAQQLADERARQGQQITMRGQDMTDARTRAEGAAGRAVTMRGQNLADARAREAASTAATAASAGKIPPGYRSKPDGTLEAIPGGPADQKAGEAGKKAAARETGAKSRADLVIGKIDEALGQAGTLSTGLAGSVLGEVPGSGAYDLKKTIDTIKANIGFQELQAMREASPTGGALGQVAVQELNMLQSVIASLDEGQSEKQLRTNLAQAKTHFENWKKTLDKGTGASGEWKIERE